MRTLTLDLADSTHDELVRLADAAGVDVNEMVRRGTQLLLLVEQAAADGADIQLVDPGTNKVRTLELTDLGQPG